MNTYLMINFLSSLLKHVLDPSLLQMQYFADNHGWARAKRLSLPKSKTKDQKHTT